ncbi:MAG TPA: transcriptional regulator, partial [Ignavibacteria bacterium]|nr:transcriptional regulator [Ignavibacteria bacterium]
GYLTTSNGLNSNTINALAVDRRGDIWVGTNLGVNIISNTYTILQSGTPQFRITSVFSLREQIINCIAVDALNRKWVGTNQGLFLVNSDGSSLLATYNTSNSPLLSNQIKSIAIDNNTGKVYVGTGAGLTSFYTAALKPVENFTKLFIYPSPFVLKNGNNHLTIDGLVRNSEIKVLTISGRLIKEFSSPGGRVAYWNGRDKNGNLVNSGIYLIVAYDSNGNNVITGKIAVLHR